MANGNGTGTGALSFEHFNEFRYPEVHKMFGKKINIYK